MGVIKNFATGLGTIAMFLGVAAVFFLGVLAVLALLPIVLPLLLAGVIVTVLVLMLGAAIVAIYFIGREASKLFR